MLHCNIVTLGDLKGSKYDILLPWFSDFPNKNNPPFYLPHANRKILILHATIYLFGNRLCSKYSTMVNTGYKYAHG